jgi:hypothetical protein
MPGMGKDLLRSPVSPKLQSLLVGLAKEGGQCRGVMKEKIGANKDAAF